MANHLKLSLSMVVIIFILFGCAESEYFCDREACGIKLDADFGKYDARERPSHACVFKSTAKITNVSGEKVYISQTRKWLNDSRDLVSIIELDAGQTKTIFITGSDIFIVRDIAGIERCVFPPTIWERKKDGSVKRWF